MSPSTVIIPCWQRPEFLAACLHYIQQAEGWDQYLYYFTIDTKTTPGKQFDPEVMEVIKAFPGKYKYKIKRNATHGNSMNLLTAYAEAMEWQKDGLIYLIETDIFVAKDFFTYHEAAHKLINDFFVSACLNQNHKVAKEGSLPKDPGGVYRWPKYQSLGNSFKPAQLKRVILHSTAWYFANLQTMQNYCKTHWPGSKFGNTWVEQDGLINRIMEAESLNGVFPYLPRAYHAGFASPNYNRPGKLLKRSLSLEERTRLILEMSEAEMNQRAHGIKDITKCNLQGYESTPLQLLPPDGIPTRQP